jgi:hypothetical protein
MAYKMGIGLLLAASSSLVLGCGDKEQAPDSTIEMNQSGAGGMAGAGGGLVIGNGSNGGTGGGMGANNPAPPTLTFHTCGMPEQECGSTPHSGDVIASTKEELAALKGIYRIEGKLQVTIGADAMDAADALGELRCLQAVTGDVSIQFSNKAGDVSLWGLRNLRTVGGNVSASNTFVRTYADCGLAKLEQVGGPEMAGRVELDRFGGELDLSKLSVVGDVRVRNTELTSIKLPASGNFALSYLQISNNSFLTTVSGFEDVLVQFLPTSATAGVQLVNNPRLSDCRATELAQLFIAGGAKPSEITQSGNLPCPAP